jgi:prolyl oligopeptidase
MNRNSVLRVARPTDNLEIIAKMYIDGLGFERLSEFINHDGFDGVILGLRSHSYHLEFTHCRGKIAGKAPTKDNLLVFYVPDKSEWLQICTDMKRAGFSCVESFNPYWDISGKTFEDVDGYRVVIQNEKWLD